MADNADDADDDDAPTFSLRRFAAEFAAAGSQLLTLLATPRTTCERSTSRSYSGSARSRGGSMGRGGECLPGHDFV